MNQAHKLERAYSLHREGRLAEAEPIYRQILKANAADPDASYLFGLLCFQQGKFAEAADKIAVAQRANPNSADILSNYGAALSAAKRHDEALAAIERVLSLKPGDIDALFNRAKVLEELGRFEEAAAGYEQVIARVPRHLEALYNRGNALAKLERYEQSLASYDRALAINSNIAEIHNNRGNTLANLKRHEEALASFDKALALNPSYAEAHANRGNALKELNRAEESLASFERALALEPRNAQTHYNLANALQMLRRHEEAIQHYEQTLVLEPGQFDVHMNLGNSLVECRRPEEAISQYYKALALKPDAATIYMNIALLHENLDRYEEAIELYDKSLALDPGFISSKWNKAIACILTGRLAEGWSLFEHRPPEHPIADRYSKPPRWNGKHIEGVLLAWGDQGLGDQILYSSMVQDLQNFADSILLEIEPRLVKLFARSFPGMRVIGFGEDQGRVDAQIQLSYLGKYFRTSWEAFPRRENGYLLADRELTAKLRQHLTRDQRFVIGLSWRSVNRELGEYKTAQLKDFESLLRLPGCRFVDLQYGDTAEEREQVERELGVRVERLEDVDNTRDIDALAALISACDAVVTVSNTTAHLAGALGQSTWVIAPHRRGRFFYWFKDKKDSPWYPRVRVFGRKAEQPWTELIAMIEREVSHHLAKP